MRRLVALAVALAVTGLALADAQVAPIFGDNMVLQRDIKVPVWGTAEPGEKVTVSVAGQTAQATAGPDKAWRVDLPALKAGGPFEMTVAGANTVTFKNVLVGEVWICSGQSNMAMALRSCLTGAKDAEEAKDPEMRLFTVGRAPSVTPTTAMSGRWQVCAPDTAGGFSAVAFYFGRELRKTLKVPVGLINTSWGGTPAEAWTSQPALAAKAEFKPLLDAWEKRLADYPAAMEKHKAALEAHKKEVEKAKAEGKRPPREPRPPAGPNAPTRPCNLFNGMINPLIPFAIRGAIWYQGEANAGNGRLYRTLLPTMINDWRARWGQGDFPFLIVQLPDFMAPVKEPVQAAGWPELREAQMMALSLPNTGMAVTLGLGEEKDIHPKNKQPVGERLALAARAVAYGEKIVSCGPLYKSVKFEGGKARISFDCVGGGLVAKDGELKGFAVAGKDGKFAAAQAKIDGADVVVWSDEVKEPAAVRYAWANNPVWSLMNKEGLPASPFRTDRDAAK
ncbi:MAG TPA: sialate O-acetylesterase [Candidatus Brocadiia bacterium]|nr:sialate O-acetylesterase [Candidatus Brocadiia bacterium]